MRVALSRRHPGLLVQTVSAKSASNEFFVAMVCAQTLRATATHALLAKKPEIDLLLRLACTTQIASAILKTGVRKGSPFLVIAAGDGRALGSMRVPRGWDRLPKRELSQLELRRVEAAALLNATRG